VRDTQPKAKAKAEPKPEPKVVFLTEEQVDEVKGAVKAYEKREELITAFKKHFKIIAPRIADRIQFPEHKEFIDKYIAENP
jgi:transposase